MEPLAIASGINVINIVILLALLHIYVRNCRALKCQFTLGLIVFAAFFLLHNVIALLLQVLMQPYYSSELGPYVLVIHTLEGLGFATLLYVSRK